MDVDTLPHSDLTVTFDTCAVIGNGGVLVHNEYGEAIDKHDAVFRFNDGPTQTFEKLVGSKTTFRIINNNWSRSWLRKRARGASEEHLLLFGMGATIAVVDLRLALHTSHGARKSTTTGNVLCLLLVFVGSVTRWVIICATGCASASTSASRRDLELMRSSRDPVPRSISTIV